MEHNELQNQLKAIGYILEVKPELKYNPLSDIPEDSIKKALSLLEEYSEEFKPIIKP